MIRFFLEFGAFVACIAAPLAVFSVFMASLNRWFGFGWAIFGGLVLVIFVAAFFQWLGDQ